MIFPLFMGKVLGQIVASFLVVGHIWWCVSRTAQSTIISNFFNDKVHVQLIQCSSVLFLVCAVLIHQWFFQLNEELNIWFTCINETRILQRYRGTQYNKWLKKDNHTILSYFLNTGDWCRENWHVFTVNGQPFSCSMSLIFEKSKI